MEAFGGLTNSAVRLLIAEKIRGPHGQRNRLLMERRLIDGITYEKLAEEFDMSVRQTKDICRRCLECLKTE